MKVIDASFLIDYEHGVPEIAAFLRTNGDEGFVVRHVRNGATR